MFLGFFHLAKSTFRTATKIVFLVGIFLILPLVTNAASLSFNPVSGSYTVGSTFTVSVLVSSASEAVNAVSGTVTFPANMLEVVSTSKSQSILSLWVQEPAYSNSVGTINFEGIILNPGYTGSNGRVLSVTFRVKNPGRADINFSTASALANDGQGTEILSSRGAASYLLSAPEPVAPADEEATTDADTTSDTVEPTEATSPAETAAVSLHSDSHPAGGWSNKTDGQFEFNVTDDITALRLLVDTKPDSIPVVVYEPPVTSRTITDLEDGISYLHVQYKNADGWGEVLHYMLQIDRVAPENLAIKTVDTGLFALTASDMSSGVDYYEVQVGTSEAVRVSADEPFYKVTNLSPGEYTLVVKAYDRAGNFVTNSLAFNVPAEVMVDDGASNDESEVVFRPEEYLLSSGTVVITTLSIVIPLLALLLLLGYMLLVSWYRFGGFRRRMDKEIAEARIMVSKAFTLLKADLEVNIKTLENAGKKRQLTRTELKLLKGLRDSIGIAEEVITKEVADIETESQVIRKKGEKNDSSVQI